MRLLLLIEPIYVFDLKICLLCIKFHSYSHLHCSGKHFNIVTISKICMYIFDTVILLIVIQIKLCWDFRCLGFIFTMCEGPSPDDPKHTIPVYQICYFLSVNGVHVACFKKEFSMPFSTRSFVFYIYVTILKAMKTVFLNLFVSLILLFSCMAGLF